MAARQPAYLNIVKQEQGHGATTECLAAVPVAVTNEESNHKPGMLSGVATVPFTGVKRAAALACVTPSAAVQDTTALKYRERAIKTSYIWAHFQLHFSTLNT